MSIVNIFYHEKLREECGLHHEYKGGRKPIELSACKQELVRIYKNTIED